MTNQGDSGNRPSWRGPESDQPRGTPRGSNSWRSTSAPRGPSPLAAVISQRWKRVRRAIAAACSLVLSGCLIVILGGMPGCTKTELIVASVGDYRDCRLPTSAFAKHDAEALDQARSRMIGTVTGGIQTAKEFAQRFKSIDERLIEVV